MKETFKDNHKLVDMDNSLPTRSRLRKGPAPVASSDNGRGYRKEGAPAARPASRTRNPRN